MLGFGQGHGMPYVLPNPDGAFDNFGDRLQLIHFYYGIAPPGAIVEAGSKDYLFRRRRGLSG